MKDWKSVCFLYFFPYCNENKYQNQLVAHNSTSLHLTYIVKRDIETCTHIYSFFHFKKVKNWKNVFSMLFLIHNWLSIEQMTSAFKSHLKVLYPFTLLSKCYPNGTYWTAPSKYGLKFVPLEIEFELIHLIWKSMIWNQIYCFEICCETTFYLLKNLVWAVHRQVHLRFQLD